MYVYVYMYGPADVTAFSEAHRLLPRLNPDY